MGYMNYEERLEVAKRLYELSNAEQKTALECIFPELCESEDEKIRKTLKHYLEVRRCQTRSDEEYINCNNFLAWLEKQGTSYTKRDVDNAFVEGMAFAKNELEKQGGQKPADKVEPKFKVKYAGNEYNVLDIKENMGITWYGIEDEPNHIDYVKANSCEIINVYGIKENGSPYPTKPAIFAGHNPSDEDMKEALRTEYEKGRADVIVEMQKELSDDDEEFLRRAINAAKDKYPMTANWLKSLKDRYTWKPSDEQMNAFKQVYDWYNTHFAQSLSLNSLYYDLKKLKVE